MHGNFLPPRPSHLFCGHTADNWKDSDSLERQASNLFMTVFSLHINWSRSFANFTSIKVHCLRTCKLLRESMYQPEQHHRVSLFQGTTTFPRRWPESLKLFVFVSDRKLFDCPTKAFVFCCTVFYLHLNWSTSLMNLTFIEARCLRTYKLRRESMYHPEQHHRVALFQGTTTYLRRWSESLKLFVFVSDRKIFDCPTKALVFFITVFHLHMNWSRSFMNLTSIEAHCLRTCKLLRESMNQPDQHHRVSFFQGTTTFLRRWSDSLKLFVFIFDRKLLIALQRRLCIYLRGFFFRLHTFFIVVLCHEAIRK